MEYFYDNKVKMIINNFTRKVIIQSIALLGQNISNDG